MKLITEQNDNIRVIKEAAGNGERQYFIEGIFLQSGIKNRNGRIYPTDLMEREVNRYIKEYVNKNRALGELGHPQCFTEKTMMLTTNGWKPVCLAEESDKVFTLKPNSNDLEIQKVNAVIRTRYTGKMIRIHGRNIDTTVTPNHRFLLIGRDGQKIVTAQEIKDKISTGTLRHDYIPRWSIRTPYVQSEIEIGSFKCDFKIFCSFLGLYLAEGNSYKRKDESNAYRITIFQQKKENIPIIQELLDQLPLNWSNHNGKYWYCYNKDLANYLHELGICYDKYIPKNILNRLDGESAYELLKWFILGDGRGTLGTKNVRVDCFSTSQDLIEDMSIVATIAGYGYKMFAEWTQQDVVIEDRIIKNGSKKMLFFLRLLNSKGVYLDDRFLQVEEVDHDGMVYCINVPNGIFLAMENNYSFWTGNSVSIQMERISHLITSLRKEGNNYIGRAKIIKEGYGKIARALIDEGVMLGVSSRGVGSVRKENDAHVVQDDFQLATAADIVADPSAPDAFVEGILENVDWVRSMDGTWVKNFAKVTKEKIHEARQRPRDLEKVLEVSFRNLVLKISGN